MIEVSIVIPSYNRREPLLALVHALRADTLPAPRTEIVVVLDGAQDGSAEALAALPPVAAMPLRVHAQENRGRAAARNVGLRLARGEVVLFLDDDVMPTPGLVAAHWRAQAAEDAVLGRIVHSGLAGTPALISEQEQDFHERRHRILDAPGASIHATDVFAGNLSVKRHLLLAIGGFDETFTGYGCEDWDLGQRLLALGARFVYVPEAVVDHRSQVSLAEWRQRAWQEGHSQLAFIRKHPSVAARLDIAGLQDATWPGRIIAQSAVQFPRLAMAVSGAAGQLVLRPRLPLNSSLRHRIAFQCWRLAFWSGVRAAVGSSAGVRDGLRFHTRILCYHRVCDAPNPALAEWAVRPAALRRQLSLLRRMGYRAVTLTELVEALDAGRPLAKTVAITFDDGYRDTVTTAAPLLAAAGMPATLFVVTDLVGGRAEWDAAHGGEMAPLASWEEIRVLRDRGWEIGHHTATHPDLTALSPAAVCEELCSARARLERAIERPVTCVAYPYGAATPAVAQAVVDAGFRVGVGLGPRWCTPHTSRVQFDRVMVKRGHTLLGFRLLLATGVDVPGLLRFGFGMPVRVLRRRRGRTGG